MKKLLSVLVIICIIYCSATTVFAADGKVSYGGKAKEFIFVPGSDYSPTDLFSNFKDVMPGDTLTQKITVKNDADKKIKVKIYIRSLGAHEDSVEFLSQLKLQVKKSEDNEMAYMFDAEADKSAQLTDWVCLGTLYSGGEVNLDAVLHVPTELDSKFQNSIGYLDWEFKIEEFPVEPDDPKAPQTGDIFNYGFWLTVFGITAFMVIIFILFNKREKKKK